MGTSTITPCYVVGTTQNQDSRGSKTQGSQLNTTITGWVIGSSMAWVSSCKLINVVWIDQMKEGLEQYWSSEPIRLLIKQKGLWPVRQGRPGCKTWQMWTVRPSRMPHKFPKWTPRWTMPRKRRCLWWNGLWLRWGTTNPMRSMLG